MIPKSEFFFKLVKTNLEGKNLSTAEGVLKTWVRKRTIPFSDFENNATTKDTIRKEEDSLIFREDSDLSVRDSPLTVVDWALAQSSGEGQLGRLLGLVQTFDPKDPAWISIVPQEHIRQQWKKIEALKESGSSLPLFGVPYAVKDNIDVEGLTTTAACPDFAYVAKEDAAVVRTLRLSGAVVVGKCNLDQFATGLVGTRSPYGAVPNTYNDKYVSGGSSSGSASVVARGLVPFSLGTDTAGSGRVPAGLNNIVGLKATPGALSAAGVVPACRSLDCVSMFTVTVADSRLVFEAAAAYDSTDGYSRRPVINAPLIATPLKPTLAICDNPPWFDRDKLQCNAYLQSLEKAQNLGWQLQPTDFSSLFQLAALLYDGPWVAERYAAIKEFIERPGVQMDPVVRGIIERAKNFNAADFFACEYIKKDLVRAIETQFQGFDAILVPTTPTFPTLEEVEKNPVIENSLLGTYTNFVNFLDWTAISIPAGFRSDHLPFGLTIISTSWQEQKLFNFAEHYLSAGWRRLGATKVHHLELQAADDPTMAPSMSDQELVIVGAHLTRFPLNYQLIEAGAIFNRTTKTTSKYSLYALPSSSVPKPGLKRCSDLGSAIEVEVWNISNEGLGRLMKLIPPPLGIGSVEVEDGTWLKGFICEPWGFEGARDISSFGGWRNFSNSLTTSKPVFKKGESGVTISISQVSNPIESILIANRGEIAVRIIATLKRLGIRSVAIYSTEDTKSQHVLDADEAYILRGNSLEETYLSGNAIIQIAKTANVDAVIPGYGFLSESARFAQACEDCGLIWIGPTPDQMKQLGLKHLARELAQMSGVPLLPGTGVITHIDTAVSEAERIRYPVIVKSSAGGGGIGLQQCNDEESLRNSFESVQHLGQSYFNDNRIFIEKFVQNARHVEVQIIGDGKGLVKHIGERDCSLQRRKQKVIEECPAVFIPLNTREKMRQAAINLAQAVQYRGVGTVEFIYDLNEKAFHFLEVNTRLQVEHCVTEAVCGLDLVEAMVRVAANDSEYLFGDTTKEFSLRKVAIEARIYGESPLQEFRPSPGQIEEVMFPEVEGVRVDTWITSGTIVSPFYDPLLAKIIVSSFDRPEAIRKLAVALDETKISGIETNLGYLKQILASKEFQNGTYTTTSLDTFKAQLPAFEVLDPGPSTTVQDYPGRVGYWDVGIPPSGPMDDYAFRLANRLLANDVGVAGLECVSAGPILLFHHDAFIAVVGAPVTIYVDDERVERGSPIKVSSGQTLRFGRLETGCRTYIAFKGGLQIPEIFGSRSTFALGKTGGHCGRPLRIGDIIPLDKDAAMVPAEEVAPALPEYSPSWVLKIMPGPHAFPDFLSETAFEDLFESSWKVHYNSNRVGIRLDGPKPGWARDHGGEAGLHPSNIHDSPYSIGSISFTGDQAVILTCDGPSLGGFMIFATIITADLWKLGQMKPGDDIKLLSVTAEDAILANENLQNSIDNLAPLLDNLSVPRIYNPVLADAGTSKERILYRQAGDGAILLEFGDNCFDIRASFRIYALIRFHKTKSIPGVLQITPGARAVHVMYQPSISQNAILASLQHAFSSLNQDYTTEIPSRTFHLPLAFEHSSVHAAVIRYAQTIRSTAPWLPSNTDFLRRINGLDTIEEVNTSLLSSAFLILGLGDVFFGSPCAVPLDPRHRLFGMKYNPSRSFTAEGSVGVGGQYMCIYATDSPGGYQLVGRTVPIWSKFGKSDKKWMFNVFDQISFYPVTEEELDTSREKGDGSELVRVEDGVFDLQAYEKWLDDNDADIKIVREKRMTALHESDAVAEAMKPPPRLQPVDQKAGDIVVEGGIVLRSGVAGKCWKVSVEKGDVVEKGQTLFIIEAMKMEIKINSPCNGVCVDMSTTAGDILSGDTRMAVLSPS